MTSGSVLPFVRGVDFSGINLKTQPLSDEASKMSNLRWLRMNKVSLEQLPEDIDSFQKLEVLYITHNKLRGLYDIDPSSFPALKVLNARDNDLKDHGISPNLFHLQDLVTLDLSHNGLTKVPDELKEAKDLIVLSLGHNNITSIPGQLFVKCAGLKYLDVSNNKIQSLPPQLRRLADLTTLNISNNPMEHFVFKVIDKLTNLTELNISNSGRTIENTPHLDKLVHLTDINMSHNGLPRIPEPVYLLEKLRRVNFSHNQIRELSSLVDTWTELVTLDLSHNLLISLHPHICKCSKLKRLFLSNNKLTFDGIPAAVGKLSSLEHFIAPHNNLECIPEGLCRCYSLKRMILKGNNLLTLPEAVHFLKIEKFDISDNPNLEMPPKPKVELQGAGPEFYNIDFNAKQLQEGAVMASSKSVKTSYSKQKERYMKFHKSRKVSVNTKGSDEESAMKVLKGLVDIADYKQQSSGQDDVLSAGAGIEVNEESFTLKTPKRWDETLVRPDLDYSTLFLDDTGTLPGITMWQIENFFPVLVEEALRHHFYMGDTYIVLNTFFNSDLELDWDIYYWIGNDSALDKKACSAMHAVNLRNMLGCRRRTKREEQGEESDEFKDLFDYNISYIEGGTASGFFSVEEQEHQIRLYSLCGEQNGKRLLLRSVALSSNSLCHTHVFVLDAGKELFVWCGGKSKLNERSKARLITERMNKLERKGRATIHMFRAGIESDEFWDFFGGYPNTPVKATPTEDCLVHPAPVVYKPGMGQGYLELPQVKYRNGLSKKLLKPNEVYLFDCYSDIYVWIGRSSARLVRAAAMRLADELVELMSRPEHTLVTRVLEGLEPMAFRLKFHDWHDILRVDYTITPQMMEKRQKEKSPSPFGTPERKSLKVDLSSLFQPRKEIITGSESEELMAYYNSILKMMQCCVIEGRKFSILPKEEKGHFYSAECYFFLCQYVIEDEESSNSEGSDEEDEELQTVVYFWQGLEASKMGWLQFTLGIQKQLEKAMGSIDVVALKQQQETLQFLSHFGGKVVVHQGKRADAQTSYKPTLYQIRANNGRLTRRIVQVPAEPKYLNSCFNHILKVPFENSPGSGIVYVWLGNETRTEEAISAEQMGRAIFEGRYSIVVVKEGAEPENFFWVALGGRAEYEKDAEYMKWRRLFRCSNEKGYFSISEKTPDFCQGDMSEDDVMLLDTGREVFIWFGSSCSEIEKKLAIKSTQVYIKHLAEEENGVKRKLKIAKRGREPWEFTRCFHGWNPRLVS